MNRLLLLTAFFILSCSSLIAQSITITPLDLTKSYNGNPNMACIEFISKNSKLMFEENTGATVQAPQKRSDDMYVYTCICDVTDKNKFGFNISEKGKIEKQILKVYIKDKQLFQYQIDVKNEDIKVALRDSLVVIRVENTARAIIISNTNNLKIESLTKEKVEGPEVTADNMFRYTVSFDMTTPESRDIDRSLTFSSESSDAKYDLGKLSPKRGIEIGVVVLATSCYDQMVNNARNSFLSGNYEDAYNIYHDNSCSDMPQDLTEYNAKMEEYRKLKIAIHNADVLYKKAEQFGSSQQDSALYYQGEAKRFRNYIRQANPSDPYCLEYERYYNDFIQKMGRQISGRVVDKSAFVIKNGNNIPLEGVIILLAANKRDTENVNNVKVPKAGKRIELKRLGETDENGNFTVYVPFNTQDIIYTLIFTTRRETMIDKESNKFEYMPQDVGKETNLIVKLLPKNLD